VSFCTAINCMDGRVQLPIIRYLMDRFGCAYVDVVTEAGPVRSMAEAPDAEVTRSILRRVAVSVEKHGSSMVAVVAHWDCAGNPLPESEQRRQLRASVDLVVRSFPGVRVLGLWADQQWTVEEVHDVGPSGALGR